MKQRLLCIGLAVAFLGTPLLTPGERPNSAANRQPVLVELFTSEGCSSCPPADDLLEYLDRTQPVAGAQIIVLSEHVDYWNRIGWADPYSSPAFSARQNVYARRFGLSGPYTPQMVVDGRTEFVGSDARRAESAIHSAARQAKLPVRILISEAGNRVATVEVDRLPTGNARKANIYLALAADRGTSNVLRGENKGRRLHHVAIVRHLQQVGSIDERLGFKQQFPLPIGGVKADRLIVFAQEPGNGPVWGAAMHAIP